MLIKKKKHTHSLIPLGHKNDKEAYKISYHCVRLIINIDSAGGKKGERKTRPLLDCVLWAFGINIKTSSDAVSVGEEGERLLGAAL